MTTNTCAANTIAPSNTTATTNTIIITIAAPTTSDIGSTLRDDYYKTSMP